jgi:hypothetical protein
VNVVRHHHVASDTNLPFTGSLTVVQERGMNDGRCEQAASQVSIERDEIKGRIVFLKNALQARRFPFSFPLHPAVVACAIVGAQGCRASQTAL